MLALVASLGTAPAGAEAQEEPTPDSMTTAAHLRALAEQGEHYRDTLPPEVLSRLSGGAGTLMALADQADQIDALAAAAERAREQAQLRPQNPRQAPSGFANDVYAGEDLFSRLTGMTQSETSVAWCGSNVLVGFNDSGSGVATEFLGESPSGSMSLAGYSRSTNAGASYTDQGALTPDPIPPTLGARDLLGDPVLGCTSPENFYYASLLTDVGTDGQAIASGISVSRSVDGGESFQPAVSAAGKGVGNHILDKPWMAVEPGPTGSPDDDIVHVTYTDFDSSGFSDDTAPCPGQARTAIEYVRSDDGGQSFGLPRVIDEVCGDPFVQGSQVDVGLDDDVYVAWEYYPADPNTTREIRIRRSTDLGDSFAEARDVTPVTPIGDGDLLQGYFRAFLDLQGLAVDQSEGERRGTVYLTFQDGRNRQKPDPLGDCGGSPTYCFADVFLTSSTTEGEDWSEPVRINDDDVRLGVDQWFPAIDVDDSGTVWTSYHDRRRDDRNFMIDTYVARSDDGGATWQNDRATENAFPPVTGAQDELIGATYMGDYIAVAADSSGRFPGVIAAWGDNSLGDANIVQRRYQGEGQS